MTTELIKKTNDQTILIASSGLDGETWKPVAEELTDKGYNVVAYEADKVADGSKSFVAHVDESGLQLHYDGQQLHLESIAAAWYRRPSLFAPWQADKAKQLSLDSERKEFQGAIWETIPEATWLNSPQRIRHAEQKLSQLVLANSLGFTIPTTVTTNQWSAVGDFLPENIILKMSRGVVYDQDELKCLYTTPLKNTPAALPTKANPFPGFWQPLLPKSREWRITVVGSETFDAAIYTKEDAKDDWRRPEVASSVTYRQETFPDSEKEKCLLYLGELGLRYGAFDFIEDEEGIITFLECNPNGQYGWLEDRLGLPISKAIAGELMQIASNSKA